MNIKTTTSTIKLYALSSKPLQSKELDTVVTRMISSGYVPSNCVPLELRNKEPYLTLHFIARDVPDIE